MDIKLHLPNLPTELNRSQQTGVIKSQESNNRYGSGTPRGSDSATLSLEVQLLQPRARLVRETLARSDKALAIGENISESCQKQRETIDATLNNPVALTQHAPAELILQSFTGYLYGHHRSNTPESSAAALKTFEATLIDCFHATLADIRADLNDPVPINNLILRELAETEATVDSQLREFVAGQAPSNAP